MAEQAMGRPHESLLRDPVYRPLGLCATRCGVVLGDTGNTPGCTRFAAATPDGRRTVTASVTSQVPLDPALVTRLRVTEERFVCALPDRGRP